MNLAAAGPDAAQAEREELRHAYPQVRARIHELVASALPAGSTVAIVSKGDDELLRLDDRRGWHFPRTDGGHFAGYHPEDGRSAVAHLDELKQRGADYFLLPSTYSWWLEQYPELAAYLRTSCKTVLSEPDTCTIFKLDPASGPALAPLDSTTDSAVDRLLAPLRSVVQALLPAGETVLVLTAGDDRLLEIGQRARRFPGEGSAGHAGADPDQGERAVAELEVMRRRGVHYLVVPRSSFWWVEQCGELRDHLATRSRLLARRERICAVFELEAGAANGRSDRE